MSTQDSKTRNVQDMIENIEGACKRIAGDLYTLREKADPILKKETPIVATYPAQEVESSIALKLANIDYALREMGCDLENIIESLDLRNGETCKPKS